jgi:hypothetical protein
LEKLSARAEELVELDNLKRNIEKKKRLWYADQQNDKKERPGINK